MQKQSEVFSYRCTTGAAMMAIDKSDDTEAWLSNLPPTSRQRWSALAVAAVLAVSCAVLVPFANRQLPRSDGFIPAFEGTIFVTDFITSILIFSQFSIYQSRALLALGAGIFLLR